MNIQYYRKNVYGQELLYISTPAIASAVRRLTGKLTIDAGDITALGVLGCTFQEVLAPAAHHA